MKNFLNRINSNKYFLQIRTILFALVAILSAYSFYGKSVALNEPLNTPISIVVGVISLVIFIIVLINEKIGFGNEIKYPFLIAGLIIFIINMIIVLATKNVFNVSLYGSDGGLISTDITITNNVRIRSIFGCLGLIELIYYAFVLLPKIVSIKSKPMVVAICIFVGFVFIVGIVTLFTNFNDYINLIKHLGDGPEQYAIKAFFGHRNNWGFVLCGAIYASIFLHALLNKKYLIAIPVILFAFLLFAMTKIAILLSFVMIASYIIYLLVNSYKNHKLRNSVIVGLASILFIALFIMSFFPPLSTMISKSVINLGGHSLYARSVIWSKIFQINSSPVHILFGSGLKVMDNILLVVNNLDLSIPGNVGTFKAHNMYMQTFADGGIVWFICFLGVLAYGIYQIIKYMKVDKKIAIIELSGYICLLIYWFFES